MAIKHFCDRCDRELQARTASIVQVKDNVPLVGEPDDRDSEALYMPAQQTVLCEGCVQSFTRWLERAERAS